MLSHEQEMEALRKQHLMLKNAYNELKRKHARLNKRYTALCVKLCRQEDYMQAASTEDNKYVVRNYRQYTQYQIPQLQIPNAYKIKPARSRQPFRKL